MTLTDKSIEAQTIVESEIHRAEMGKNKKCCSAFGSLVWKFSNYLTHSIKELIEPSRETLYIYRTANHTINLLSYGLDTERIF